jgi:hypothetical protein
MAEHPRPSRASNLTTLIFSFLGRRVLPLAAGLASIDTDGLGGVEPGVLMGHGREGIH